MNRYVAEFVPGLIGAAVGGVVGYYLYGWGIDQHLKAGVVPGAFVGLGAGMLSRDRSARRGVICGVAALALGLYAEWRYFPFVADGSLPYFLAHIHQLLPLSLIMIAFGTFLGFRWGGGSFRQGSYRGAGPEGGVEGRR